MDRGTIAVRIVDKIILKVTETPTGANPFRYMYL